MSINSLANAAIARRTDFAPAGSPPRGLSEIASAAAFAQPLQIDLKPFSLHPDRPTPAPAPQPGGAPPTPPNLPAGNGVNTAMHVLFGYIPTEILTLYVAVLAALHKPGQTTNVDWRTFVAFLIATPFVVWLVYAGRVIANTKPVPIWPSQWPFWEMFAATVAYLAWAFALPDTPFSSYNWYSSALAGVIVLLASAILGLLAPLFQRAIKPS
jgi:hypothetical protein